jgi:SAM-dependent methyltransferase
MNTPIDQVQEDGAEGLPCKRFVPALGHHALTCLYDPVVRWTTRERTFKAALMRQAAVAAGDHVLDLACGTATLTIQIKLAEPDAHVLGLDGDRAVLTRAAGKVRRAGAEVTLVHGLAERLPFGDATFDCVVSSLFLHHLDRAGKMATLREVSRVLRPSGLFHVADWGKASGPLARGLFLGIQVLDGFATTADNVAGRIPEFLRESGFDDVTQTNGYATPFGTLALYRGRRAS